MRFDLVSVGGGLAGLVAATRAAQRGLRTAVLEAGERDDYACNSRIAGGILHAAYQDITLPPDALLRGMRESGVRDETLASTIASRAGEAFDWLRCQGVRFAHFPHVKRGAWVMAPPRPLVTGMMGGYAWRGRGPDLALRTLTARLRAAGGQLFLGTRAQRLVMRDGRCEGVVARTSDGPVTFVSSAVVLADGGFSASPELFRKNIGPAFERVLQRGAGTGRGDALRMAVDAGAATSALDRFYGHILSRDALSNYALWPYPQVDALAAAGLVCGPDGERLFDEGLGGIYAANHLATLPDPACATVIVDASIWNGTPGRGGLVAPNPALLRHGATIHMADDVRTLAQRCGMPAERLQATIDAYNRALAGGRLDALSPIRTQRKARAMPIEHAPLLAIPICTGITNTMGGIAIDGSARVRARDGTAIEGLYAAGAATGGLEGGPHVDYVGGLIKASVFGLCAADHAAASLRVNATEEMH